MIKTAECGVQLDRSNFCLERSLRSLGYVGAMLVVLRVYLRREAQVKIDRPVAVKVRDKFGGIGTFEKNVWK